MVAPRNSNPEALWRQATKLRWLARETLPGEFRTTLLTKAINYELQAAKLQGLIFADDRSNNAEADPSGGQSSGTVPTL
jgi:hypothetical protein